MKKFTILLYLLFPIIFYAQEKIVLNYDNYIAALEKNHTKKNQKKINELKNNIEKKQSTTYIENSAIKKYTANAKVLHSDIQSITNLNNLITTENNIELLIIYITKSSELDNLPNKISTENLTHLKYILFGFEIEISNEKATQFLYSVQNKNIILYKNEMPK